jgi:hypothetical protein
MLGSAAAPGCIQPWHTAFAGATLLLLLQLATVIFVAHI